MFMSNSFNICRKWIWICPDQRILLINCAVAKTVDLLIKDDFYCGINIKFN